MAASVILFVAAAYLLLRGAQLFALVRGVLAARYRLVPARAVPEDEVPAHARELLERVAPWRALGFEHAVWVMDGPVIGVPPHPPTVWRLMARPGSPQRLWLQASPLPEPGNELNACLITDFEDATRVETDDIPGEVPWLAQPPWMRLELAPGVSAAELVARHEAVARTVRAAPLDDGVDAALGRFLHYHRELTRLALARGDLIPSAAPGSDLAGPAGRAGPPPDSLAPSLRAALRLALRTLAALSAVGRIRRARALAAQGALPVPIAAEVGAWERVDAPRAHPTPRWLLGLGLAVTGGVFAATLLVWAEASLVAAITFVVLFHELGHWSAMRLRGYSDARIFFIPMLGGATTGHKERISLADEMIVLLAGPLPGLAIGLVLAFALAGPQPAWVGEVTRLLLVVNGLNLLPVFPLDGGRVVHRLFAHGRPVREIAFRTLGALAFVALGMGFRSVVLAALGGLLLVGTRSAWQSATLERTLRANGLPEERAARRAAILAALRTQTPTASLGVRIARARQLATRLDAPPAEFAARAAWFSGYALALAAGVGLPIALVAAGNAWWRPTPRAEAAEGVHVTCAEVASLDLGPLPTRVTLRPDVRLTRSARDALDLHAFLAPYACAPAPWERGALPATRAQRVLETLHLLNEARDAAFADLAARTARGAKRDPEAERRQVHDELENTLTAYAADPTFDPDFARAWIDVLESGATSATRARLGATLGLARSCDPAPPGYDWDGSRALLTVTSTAELEPLAGYMCAAGVRAFVVGRAPVLSAEIEEPVD